jgi:hypothetical protein
LECAIRMHQTRVIRKILESEVEGRRGVRRLRFRWLEDVGTDLR